MSAVPVRPSIDIWRSCRFFRSMLLASCQLLGGIGRFVPCRIGANHCRLWGLGWEQSWSWSDFWASEGCRGCWVSGSSLVLFWYPAHSGADSVAGTFRFRFCQVSFLIKKPTWGVCHGREGLLLFSLILSWSLILMMCSRFVLRAYRDVSGAVRVGESRKRIRFTKKTPVLRNPHAGHLGQPIPRRWKRLHVHGVSSWDGDAMRWRLASVLRERHGTG